MAMNILSRFGLDTVPAFIFYTRPGPTDRQEPFPALRKTPGMPELPELAALIRGRTYAETRTAVLDRGSTDDGRPRRGTAAGSAGGDESDRLLRGLDG